MTHKKRLQCQNNMYPIFWTQPVELNNSFFIMDASRNFTGGIHFVFA